MGILQINQTPQYNNYEIDLNFLREVLKQMSSNEKTTTDNELKYDELRKNPDDLVKDREMTRVKKYWFISKLPKYLD